MLPRKMPPRLTVTIDWRDPVSALRVLLGSDVSRFMRACAAADLRLIQLEPFVPFASGPEPGPVAMCMVGAAVPRAFRPSSVGTWSQLTCVETGNGHHGPVFKTRCGPFTNPKIFVRVASYNGMFGFGAYIEWLRRKNSRELRGLAVRHFRAFVELMRSVFGEGTRVLVHNTDVKYFHIKKDK
jgi:hypothetical protein